MFDPVKKRANVVFKWFYSRTNGVIRCESQSSVLEIPAAYSKEGLWFCVAEFKDENNEKCRITSEMFETLDSTWKGNNKVIAVLCSKLNLHLFAGRIPQLDRWPFFKHKSGEVRFVRKTNKLFCG